MHRTASDRFYVEAVGSTLGKVQGYFVACRFSILIKESKHYGGVTQQFVCSAEQMVYLGNLAMEVVASTEVVVFSFGVFISANFGELPILTTRKQKESKKQPRRIGHEPTQQGYSFSSKIVRLAVYFTPPVSKIWLSIWSAFVSCIFIMANQRLPRSFILAPT